MHFKRWLTGIIAIPILIYLIGFGPRWLFYAFLYLSALAGLIEFYKISINNLPGVIRFIIYLLSFLLFIIFSRKQILFLPIIIFLWALAPLLFHMLTYSKEKSNILADIGLIFHIDIKGNISYFMPFRTR